MKYDSVVCPICNKENLKKINIKFEKFRDTTLSICDNDSLVFLSKRATKEDYLRYYSTEYDNDYRPDDLDIAYNTGYKNSSIIYDRLKEYFNGTNINEVLDIGSGPGYNLKFFNNKFKHANFHAIEPSKACQEIIEKNGFKILSNDFEKKWNSKQKFDLVISRHSFEHSLDPNSVLINIYDSLKEDGLLYIAVPNMCAPRLPLKNYWFRIVHTYYFSIHTLKLLLQKNKLEIIKYGEDNNELWIIAKLNNSKQQKQIKIESNLKQIIILKTYLLLDLFYSPIIGVLKSTIKKLLK